MKIGLVRLAVLRSTPVFTLVNIAMVGYLFLKSAGWSHWYPVVFGLLGLWVWVDMRFIWKSEINETFSRSEDIQEMKKSIEKIEKYVSALRAVDAFKTESARIESLRKDMENEYQRGVKDGRAGHE